MADITRLGEIAMPKLSENMAPEDRRSINNYLKQLRDQKMYMMQNLDETNFSDTMRDKLVAMGYLTGSSGKVDDQGRPADLDLSRDMLRILVICDRAGVFG